MKRTLLRIVIAAVLICLSALPLTYSAFYVPSVAMMVPKIYFLNAPGAVVAFGGPVGSKYDEVDVWAGVMTDSTYGKFKMAAVMYSYGEGGACGDAGVTVCHHEDYWFTTNLAAGKHYVTLTKKVYGPPADVWDKATVTSATITTSQTSGDQLSVTVKTGTKLVFTVQYLADTSQDIVTRLEIGTTASPDQFLSTEARRHLLEAGTVFTPRPGTFAVGPYWGGWFKYMDTELYDPALLV